MENKPDKLTGIRLGKNSNVKSRWNSGICSLCGKWCVICVTVSYMTFLLAGHFVALFSISGCQDQGKPT